MRKRAKRTVKILAVDACLLALAISMTDLVIKGRQKATKAAYSVSIDLNDESLKHYAKPDYTHVRVYPVGNVEGR